MYAHVLSAAGVTDRGVKVGHPARRVASDDPTRTRTLASQDTDSCPPRASQALVERLHAPLHYRDPGRYQIVADHGRGGVGRVYRARDNEMGRDVALKELLHRDAASELRFFREAFLTAHLDHPGIVPVHHAGRWPDGTPFYTMKLITGRTLKELIQECTSIEQRLLLLPHVIAVADAIAYAHQRKIIHRDIKPSNVMVGDCGATVVIDWGLAKVIDDVTDSPDSDAAPAAVGTAPSADGVTVAGSVLGTPAYMAPEQARGEPVDARADVYAIGAMLEVLCSEELLPSSSPARSDVRQKISAPAQLLRIIARATAPARACRYSDAAALAAALRGLGLRSQANARQSRVEAGGWIRRTRKVATAMVAALTLSVALAACHVPSAAGPSERAESAATGDCPD